MWKHPWGTNKKEKMAGRKLNENTIRVKRTEWKRERNKYKYENVQKGSQETIRKIIVSDLKKNYQIQGKRKKEM